MKKYLSIVLSLLLIFSLCACGQSAPSSNKAAAPESIGYAGEELAFDSMASTPAAAPEEGTGASDVPETNPEKIIYSADIQLETTEFDDCNAKLAELIEKYGGYIESSSKSDASFYAKSKGNPVFRSAQYTIRIPSTSFSEISGDLSQLGNIPYNNTYTENVSAQYYDTEARLKSYTAQEERLLEMLESAQSIEDILAIEGQLANVRYEIESLQSSLKNWDRRINYSTIHLDVQEVSEYSDQPAPSQNYGQRLWRSLKNGLYGVGNFFQNFLVWLVGALPAIAVIAVLFFVLRPLFRKIKTGRNERKAKKAAENQKTENK